MSCVGPTDCAVSPHRRSAIIEKNRYRSDCKRNFGSGGGDRTYDQLTAYDMNGGVPLL